VLKKFALIATSFVTGVALTLLAVGYQTPTVAADDAEMAHTMAMKAQVMHTIYMLDSSGLHAIDESTHAGTIPAGALGTVRRARIMTQATEWPDALKDQAAGLVNDMKALEATLQKEDAAGSADLAAKVHDGGHDLSAAVYTWLDTGTGPSMSEHSH
jgi:hypothetical protein